MTTGSPAAADAAELVERLRPFVAEALPELSSLSSARRLTGGLSCLTYLVGGDGWEAILRRPPRGAPPQHDFAREFRVLERMSSATSIPVPRPLLLWEDPSVIGAPFFLMDRVEGVVLGRDTAPALRAQLDGAQVGTLLVEVLADLARVPPEVLPSRKAESGYLERQLGLFRRLWDANKTREVPEVEELAAWLESHRPTTQRLSAVHGDFKIDNVMFVPGGEPGIAAILDWELAAAGDPLVDLGWLLFFLTLDAQDELELGDHAIRAGTAFPARGELADRYASRTGLDLAELPWYVALSGFKLAAIMEGSYRRYLEGDRDYPQFAALEHAVVRWARRGLRAARSELAL
ncbi:MAG: phosphotransferase family protein [Conexibacter sp.]|nr:phosphotransferase family protein [Conexibacter sp.]